MYLSIYIYIQIHQLTISSHLNIIDYLIGV